MQRDDEVAVTSNRAEMSGAGAQGPLTCGAFAWVDAQRSDADDDEHDKQCDPALCS